MQVLDVCQLHRDLVAIPSLSHEENEAADFMESIFSAPSLVEKGLSVKRIENNVVIEWGSSSPTLLLNSHLDVVPPSSDHPYPPFEPTVANNRVYGRGSVDAKASVACMATAILRLAESGYTPKGRLIAAFTACEETGGDNNGLERVFPELPRIDAALVGEPTHMQPCVAQKGLLILRLDAKGKSAHAARAEEGENAIQKMARDLVALDKLTFNKVHPYLGETTANVTVINGGTARNSIPDLCSAYVDIRSTPSYTHDEIAALVQQHVESEVLIHSKRFVPVDTQPSERIVQSCLRAHEGSSVFGSPTMSDWIHLKGIPTVKIGPGDSRLSHTAAESILIDELTTSCIIYQDIIKHFFE